VHAKLVRDGEQEVRLVDLESTNGCFVNGTRIESRVLDDGDMIQIGKHAVIKYTLQSDVEGKFSEQLYEAATRDATTGLLNRRFFDEQLTKDVAHALRHQAALSVLVFDLDFFKKVNDTYGHPAGDKVLTQLGAVVLTSVRTEDVACRLGGEEFAIVMRDTRWQGARDMAERLRAAVADHQFDVDGTNLKVTVSVGTATLDPSRHTSPAALLEEADQAMYRAKREGRNRVETGPKPVAEVAGTSTPPSDLKKTIT
jgi:diguanylate cyclase (GGDEF)-like protein